MKKMLKLVLISYTFILCACSPQNSDDHQAAAQLKSITIGQYGDLLIYLPLYIAKDAGFFEEEGLDVNFINGGGDDKTYAAVASGSAQFGVSDPTFTAIAREKGQSGVVIASIVSGATYWGVTWNDDIQPIKNLKDLEGRRIATYEAPSTNWALMSKTVKQSQLENVSIVEGAYGTLLAMLKSDRADIAMELEPVASTAVANGAHIVFSYPDAFGPFLLTGLYVLEEYRDANINTVQEVVNALEKALNLAHTDTNLAIAIAQARFPDVDSQVIVDAVTRMIKEKTLPTSTRIDPVGWHNAVNVRAELGHIKNPQQADLVLDHRFSEAAAN